VSDVLPRLTEALSDRYRVTREVGAGGMATVYLAHDIRHDRDVAIKVLHPDLAAALGAERFLAEIKTTAKLQHPHILPLLDSGEAGGLLYYVMPYVSGESLRSRLERETQLPVDDAVRIAREVLSALESAHKQGVVHRDIKPENILLHEDQALVADFGIALAVSAAGGPRMTQTGLSLGTPAYMAPEQAMGERVIDGRADIYASGAVLYEMLVGEAPFTGPTVQAIVARVMTESPRPVTGQRRSVPGHVNAAVLRALQKLPADRFHTAAEFAKALVTPGLAVAELPSEDDQKPAQRVRTNYLKSPIVAWVVAALALVAAGFALTRGGARSTSDPIRLSVDPGPEVTVGKLASDIIGNSDDGQMIAFGARSGGVNRLFTRRLSEDELKSYPAFGGISGSAAFSPDGKWIAFTSSDKLLKMPVDGGAAIQIGSSRWGQMTWIGNDAIVYVKNYNTGLNRVSADGKDTATLTKPDTKKGELGHWWPQLLPDGDHLLFTNYTTPADQSKIEVLSLKSGKREVVLEGGYYGRYVAGKLLYVRGDAVNQIAFDPGKLKTSGNPSPLGLDIDIIPANGWAGYAFSKTGTLVYFAKSPDKLKLTWADEGGAEEAAVDSVGHYSFAIVSPDAKSIAVVMDGDVWVYNRARHLFTRLTSTEQVEGTLVWTPDSKRVLYQRDVPQYDLFIRSADGSGAEQVLVSSANDKNGLSVSPDGATLLYTDDGLKGSDIYMRPMGSDPRAPGTKLVSEVGSQGDARISPDGLWMVYSSDESGRTEVYLAPFPAGPKEARTQLSLNGGSGGEWGPDGRTVYYTGSDRIVRVRVNPRTGDVGKPEPLERIARSEGWTIAPDGRFLLARAASGPAHGSLRVILNWESLLRKSTQ
jgi:serine/threonine-protein kinase